MVINSSGPVNSKNQSKKWLLFGRERKNPAESDVSGMSQIYAHLFFVI